MPVNICRTQFVCFLFILSSVASAQSEFAVSDAPSTEDAATLVYDPSDGNMAFNAGGLTILAFELLSPNGIFNFPLSSEGCPSEWKPPSFFDVCQAEKIFLLSEDGSGFSDIDLGQIAPAGLKQNELLAELVVDGAARGEKMALLDQDGGGPYLWLVSESSIAGDFNESGALDIDDVNLLASTIAGGMNDEIFDLNGDSSVDLEDIRIWIKDLRNSFVGDANLDGEFNSGDLAAVFQAAKYELDENAGWAEGDWTGDGRFDTADLTAAFQDGGYERGPRVAVAAVPEPASFLTLTAGLIALAFDRRRYADCRSDVINSSEVDLIM